MAIQRMTVGEVEIIAAQDSVFPAPVAVAFPSVPMARWQEVAPAVAEEGIAHLTIGCFLVRAPGRTLLVDTGIGPAGGPGFGIPPGHLLDSLKEAGAGPEDIDAVVISHLHVDHVGWNAREENGVVTPTFPNARYFFGRSEYEFFSQPQNLEGSPFLRSQAVALVEQGRVELWDGENALGGPFQLLSTPGHTPGHATLAITSGGEHGFILGDVAHHPAQVTHPDLRPAFDLDGDLAEQTRADLFARLQELGARVAAGHFPAPGFGRIVLTEGRRVWQPSH